MKIEEWLKQEAQKDRDEHVRPEVQALVKPGNITSTEAARLRCNSWEWEEIYLAMDDESFVRAMEHALSNSSRNRQPFGSYDEAVQDFYAPELLRRFKEKHIRERPGLSEQGGVFIESIVQTDQTNVRSACLECVSAVRTKKFDEPGWQCGTYGDLPLQCGTYDAKKAVPAESAATPAKAGYSCDQCKTALESYRAKDNVPSYRVAHLCAYCAESVPGEILSKHYEKIA
jgi:hypothetical protein